MSVQDGEKRNVELILYPVTNRMGKQNYLYDPILGWEKLQRGKILQRYFLGAVNKQDAVCRAQKPASPCSRGFCRLQKVYITSQGCGSVIMTTYIVMG